MAALDYMGRALAEVDGNPETSRLPTVGIARSSQSDRWQLVTVTAGQALLMRPTVKPVDRKFRVVTTTELQVGHGGAR